MMMGAVVVERRIGRPAPARWSCFLSEVQALLPFVHSRRLQRIIPESTVLATIDGKVFCLTFSEIGPFSVVASTDPVTRSSEIPPLVVRATMPP